MQNKPMQDMTQQKTSAADAPVAWINLVYTTSISCPRADVVARPSLYADLRDSVMQRHGSTHAVIALHGQPGIGKSVLMAQLAGDAGVQAGFPDGVVWVQLTDTMMPAEIVDRQRLVGQYLGVQLPDDTNVASSTLLLQQALRGKTVLLMIDGVWTREQMDAFTDVIDTANTTSRVVVTTRRGHDVYGDAAKVVEVSSMQPAEAKALIMRITNGAWFDPEGSAIIRACGGHCQMLCMIARLVVECDATHQLHWSSVLKKIPFASDVSLAAVGVANVVQWKGLNRKLSAYFRQLAVLPADASVPASLCAVLWRVTLAEARAILCALCEREVVQLEHRDGSALTLHDAQLDVLRSRATASQTKQWHGDIIDGYMAAMENADDWGTLAGEMRSLYFTQHLVRNHVMPGGKAREAVEGAFFSLTWLHQRLQCDGNVDGIISDLNVLQRADGVSRRDAAYLRGAVVHAVQALALSTSRLQLVFSLQQSLVGVSAQQRPLCARLMQQCVDALRRAGGMTLLPRTAIPVDTSLQMTLRCKHTGLLCVATYQLPGHTADVYAVSGSMGRALGHWNLSTGQLIDTMSGHDLPVTCVVTYLQGSDAFAVSGSVDESLRVWRLTTGEHVATLDGHEEPVYGVAIYTEHGVAHAVSVSSDETLRVWNLQTMQHVRTPSGHVDGVCCVASYIQDDAAFAVSGSRDTTLRLWRLGTGERVRILTGHTQYVNAVATYRRGDVVMAVSGASDSTIRVWDLTTGVCAGTIHVDAPDVFGVAVYHRDNTDLLVAGTSQGTVEVWDIDVCRRVNTLRGGIHRVHDVAVYYPVPDKGAVNVISAYTDGTLRVFSIDDAPDDDDADDETCPPGHSGCIRRVVMYCDAASGRMHAVTASMDQSLRMWDTETGENLHTSTGHAEDVTCLAAFTDGNEAYAIIGAMADSTLQMWHLASGKLVHTMADMIGSAVDVRVYQRHGIWYAVSASSDDGRVNQWNTKTGQLDWAVSLGDVWSVALYHRTGTWCAVLGRGDDGDATVLDLVSGQVMQSLGFQAWETAAVQCSPDAVLIAGHAWSGSALYVCDPSSDVAPRVIKAEGQITRCAIALISATPYALVATERQSLQLFNMLTGALVHRIVLPGRIGDISFAQGVVACAIGSRVLFFSVAQL